MTTFGGEGVAVEDTDWIRSTTLKISLGTDFSITRYPLISFLRLMGP